MLLSGVNAAMIVGANANVCGDTYHGVVDLDCINIEGLDVLECVRRRDFCGLLGGFRGGHGVG